MHKVVLEVKDGAELETLAQKLVRRPAPHAFVTAAQTDQGIAHWLWIEQPEGIPTCLATKPYLKQDAPGALKKYAHALFSVVCLSLQPVS